MGYEEAKRRKTRNIRLQVLGMAILKTAANGEGDVHIHYHNENDLPPSAMSTPMMQPQEKFTMDKETFRQYMRKQYEGDF